jgi:hypothetical protein
VVPVSKVTVFWRAVLAFVGGAALVAELYPLAQAVATSPLNGWEGPAWVLHGLMYGVPGLIAGGVAGMWARLLVRAWAWIWAAPSALAGLSFLWLTGEIKTWTVGAPARWGRAWPPPSDLAWVAIGALVGVGLLSLIQASRKR